ncbi:GMC family oxidoreductase [Dongia soli]|uniref:GMC family oxidoreductase N-terminal domain-containing protein n=1 Tax=Dongia soli TaxID=600628 RepID=A0ABU5E5U6_9PROT|nr:GMC family oxidoreductase N-terminal domain-containing protein [Dongia soli]MDY0881519.1 GMC family oxidoreductase N-terminal domain-containing protein [Dongia soli]
MTSFDFIIIGAGSAGCVLANRLTADGRYNVLVVEAGGSDRRLWIQVPIGYGKTFFDRRVNWAYETESVSGLNDRKIYWPRGRVLGGSSSINASVYLRGLPEDFDDWRDMGNAGWGWADVEPYFNRSTHFTDRQGRRTGEGPLAVSEITDQAHPLKQYFFDAAKEIALPRTDDMNGPAPEGVGLYQINVRNGRRCSAADAFLRPAMRRPNLKVETDALVTRILIDSRRAVGIEYRRDGQTHRAMARAEVIVSGGAVNTPQLLQLSGIGPAEVLRRHGIDIITENAAIGGNLQDHLAMTYSYKSRQRTLNNELRPLFGRLRAGLRYVATRRGPLSLSVNQCGGFVRSQPQAARPDLQLYFNPITYSPVGRGGARRYEIDPFPGFILCFQPCRPTSRGRIDLRNSAPESPPLIHPNYLATNEDAAKAIAGGRLIQRIEATRAFQSLIEEPLPPALAGLSDEEILEDFRNRASTCYHPTSTCRMGRLPGEAGVDANLLVFGIDRLRVVDASVFPAVTSGNTNAPTIMVAEKASELILRRAANG